MTFFTGRRPEGPAPARQSLVGEVRDYAALVERTSRLALRQAQEQLTLNQRVPGSSPGAPTKQINNLAVWRVEHSDNSSPAHSDKFPLSVLLLSLFRAAIFRCSSVSFAWSVRTMISSMAVRKIIFLSVGGQLLLCQTPAR